MYLDTCIEPWPGGYTDAAMPAAKRTNYALREEALALRSGAAARAHRGAHARRQSGPGLALRQAGAGQSRRRPGRGAAKDWRRREDWADLAQRLDVRVIHVAERDTQVSSIPKEPNEFVNTWSVDGFVSEGSQPAELGWGSHERNFPRDGKRFDFGDGAAIYLMQPGVATRVRSWAPHGRPLPRLPDHPRRGDLDRRLPDLDQDPAALYRPTVHYAYHPSDNAVLSVHEFCGPQLHDAGPQAHHDGRHHHRHRRAGRAARRP